MLTSPLAVGALYTMDLNNGEAWPASTGRTRSTKEGSYVDARVGKDEAQQMSGTVWYGAYITLRRLMREQGFTW